MFALVKAGRGGLTSLISIGLFDSCSENPDLVIAFMSWVGELPSQS